MGIVFERSGSRYGRGSISSSGGGGGGVAAAHLPQDNDSTLGLFIGLENENAGPDWLLDMRQRSLVEVLPMARLAGSGNNNGIAISIPREYLRPSLSRGNNWNLEVMPGTPAEVPDVAAVPATAEFNFASSIGPTSIVITMPTSIAEGSFGNDWRIRFLADNNALASPVVVTIDETNQFINIQKHALPSVTWAQVINAMNAAIGAGSTVPTYGSDPGDQSATSNAPTNIPALGAAATRLFTGGVDAYNLDTPASLTLTLTGSQRTITINFPASLGTAAAGNGWRFILAGADAGRQSPTAGDPDRGWAIEVDNPGRRITARRGLGNTADNLAHALNQHFGAGTASAGGTGAATLDNSQQDLGLFAGGADAQPPQPRTPLAASFNLDDPASNDMGDITLSGVLEGDTLTEIVAVLNGTDYPVRFGVGPGYADEDEPYTEQASAIAVLSGDGTVGLDPLVYFNAGSPYTGTPFSAGTDIEPIHGSIDQDNKIVQLHYDDNDTLAELKVFLNGEEIQEEHTTLLAIEIAETDLARSPVPPTSDNIPFVDYYAQGSFPTRTAATPGGDPSTLTGQQIINRIDGTIGTSWRSGVAPMGEVKNQTGDYTILDSDAGNTIRFTGTAAATFTLPDGFDIGEEVVIINDGTAEVTIDGAGTDTIDGAATHDLPAGEALRVQYVAADTWTIVADTRRGVSSSGLNEDQARDIVGALLATLAAFTYDPDTDTPTFQLPANSVTAAQARATSNAHKEEWRTRLEVPSDAELAIAAPQNWADIPNGEAITIGKVVHHGGRYFGCITNHNRGGTGPDGDPANWIVLSNYGGNWVAAWYPPGMFVTHAGLPWVATALVTVNDVAPDDAANTKWLRLGIPADTFAELTGATFTGAVKGISPVADEDFTTKEYVDAWTAVDGAGFATTLIGRGNFNTSTANQAANEADSTDITIPLTGEWGIINFGRARPHLRINADWHWINLTALRATASLGLDYGDALTNADVLYFPDAIGIIGLDVFLAVNSDRKLLVAGSRDDADAFPLEIRLVAEAPLAGTPPREIDAGAGGTYNLRDAENEIHVDIEITHNVQGTRTYTERVIRGDLSSTPKDYVQDGRNPDSHESDADSRFVGFSASIAGNVVTLDSGNYQGTISSVWGIVSGSEGPQGEPGPTDSSASTSEDATVERDHERISALEALTQGLALRDHEIWQDVTQTNDFAVHIIPSPVSGLSANLPGYPWAVSETIPSDGNYIVLLRLAVGRHPNWLRVVRDNDAGVEQETIRGTDFHYAGLEQGGFDYYIRPAEMMSEDDVLTLQWGTVDAHTEYRDRVVELDEHESNPSAHQDSPRRQPHLGVDSPAGRRVYLTEDIRHPIRQAIMELPVAEITQLAPNLRTFGGATHPRFVGASVLDFSGVNGPVATADQTDFPSFMSATVIAGIWQGSALLATEPARRLLTVAVLSTLQPAAPTHIHIHGHRRTDNQGQDYGDQVHALTEVTTTVIGGRTYRIMETQVSPGLLSNTSPGFFRFAIQYQGGYLQADGSVDIGISYAIGHYVSLGNGEWESDEVEDFAREASPEAKFPESRYKLRDGQLIYAPPIEFTYDDGVGAFGDDEWRRVAGNNRQVLIRFSESDHATEFIQNYPTANPLWINGDEYMATAALLASDLLMQQVTITLDRDVPDEYTNVALQIRHHSELPSVARVTTIARGLSGSISRIEQRNYPQTAVLFAWLADGTDPATQAPDVDWDETVGPIVFNARGLWALASFGIPARPPLGGPYILWRCEVTFRYNDVVSAWGRTPPLFTLQTTNAILFATDNNGTNADTTPPDNWTHFAWRLPDGSLSDWIARGLQGVTRDHLFASYRSFSTYNGQSNHYSEGSIPTLILPVIREFRLADYSALEFYWRSYIGNTVRFAPPKAVIEDLSGIKLCRRNYDDTSEVQSDEGLRRDWGLVRAVFGGHGHAFAAVMGSNDTIDSPGLSINDISIPGSGPNTAGCVIDMKLRGDQVSYGFRNVPVQDILIHDGSQGTGRLDIYGVRA